MKTNIKSVVIESMTIPFTISIAGHDDQLVKQLLQQLIQPVQAGLEVVNKRYSTYLEGSLVNDFRNGDDDLLKRDAEFKQVYDACLKAKAITNGYFDPFDDNDLYDPLGYVKGWAIKRLFQTELLPLMKHPEIDGVCFNGGGDLQFAGTGDFKWTIGIEDPKATNQLVASYQLQNGGMATSGYSKRGEHIRVNGAPDLLQVTTYSSSLTKSDIWATAGLAAGEAEFRRLIQANKLTGCFVNQNHQLSYFSGGMITNVE
ncbi:FAD:protein FMN transferase [Lactobacillus sp. Sy-1]|uniref:FAD:protein FMN transferase n=1 Tax=Lactobacillus sp. Sy-1 TaxID=2109645 RepID=UPI001C5ACCB9|nr:FAD:protein FMN transferase [Lactobacillus sp. Sy-1]MBW1606169.1 FAD:protein FMN transferase [Lactobacillus sp. Sy-1]